MSHCKDSSIFPTGTVLADLPPRSTALVTAGWRHMEQLAFHFSFAQPKVHLENGSQIRELAPPSDVISFAPRREAKQRAVRLVVLENILELARSLPL